MDLYSLHIFTPAAAPASVHWTTYVTALLTPMIAIIAAWIAYSQWKTARRKLKLDLFEKRLEVYDAARTAIGQIIVHGKVSAEVESAYLMGIAGAKWLFDKKMVEYLNQELWMIISKLHAVQAEQIGAPQEERRAAVQKQFAVLEEINTQLQSIDSRFYPFLSLGH